MIYTEAVAARTQDQHLDIHMGNITSQISAAVELVNQASKGHLANHEHPALLELSWSVLRSIAHDPFTHVEHGSALVQIGDVLFDRQRSEDIINQVRGLVGALVQFHIVMELDIKPLTDYMANIPLPRFYIPDSPSSNFEFEDMGW